MSLSVWIRNHVRGWALESRCLSRSDIVSNRTLGVRQYVMWDAASVALLKKLWASGHSAGQIAGRLGHSRNAVCAKLLRMGLKRGHRPPKEFTKSQLNAMLAEAITNTARLAR